MSEHGPSPELPPQSELPEIPADSRLDSERLTVEQEQQLAAEIQAGREALRELSNPKLPDDRRSDLAEVVERGEAAEEKMVNSNLGLVEHFINQIPVPPGAVLSREDLIQEGRIGLIKAAQKYQAEGGARFATYARYWIRAAALRSLAENAQGLRLPAHIGEEVRKLAGIKAQLTQAFGREPTLEEITDASDQSLYQVRSSLRADIKTVPLESGRGFGSSREYTDTEGQPRLKADIVDKLVNQEPGPEEQAIERAAGEQFYRMLIEESGLTERQQRVLEMRFGFDNADGVSMTQQEVGSVLGLAGSRVRRIEQEGLEILKQHALRLGLNLEGEAAS